MIICVVSRSAVWECSNRSAIRRVFVKYFLMNGMWKLRRVFFNSCSPSVLSLFVFSLFFPSFLYFVISFCIPFFLSVFPSILYAFYRYHDFPWHTFINLNHLFTGVCSPKTNPSLLVWNSLWWALSPTYPANCCINWWHVLEAILFSHCVCSFALKWWLG